MNKVISLVLLALFVGAEGLECGQSKYPDAGRYKENINYQGWLSREGEFPYQALLVYLGEAVCGGVLIDDRHVLTAAHCTRGDPASEHTVILGDFNRVKPNKHRRQYAVQSIVEHAEYEDFTMVNDISLLRLAERVEFSDHIQPICLPEKDQSFLGQSATVSGWSSFQPGSMLTNESRYINVELSDFEECKTCYDPEPVEPGMVCVGFCGNKKKHYACQGDLGGAAAVKVCEKPDGMCLEGGSFYLAGLISWGYGCEDVYPGVLTDVPFYMDWIEQHMTQ